MISRLVSLEHPHEIKPGMVFALETFWPSTDGWSAARIEEEIVVTRDRPRGDHALPGRGAARGRRAVRHRRRHAADDARDRGAAPNPEVVEMIARRGACRGATTAGVGGQNELNGDQRRDACARDGAGDGQARLVAEEGRGAGQEGRDAPRGRDRQGRRGDRGAERRHARRRDREGRRRRSGRPDDRVAAEAGRGGSAAASGADADRPQDGRGCRAAARGRRSGGRRPRSRPRRLARGFLRRREARARARTSTSARSRDRVRAARFSPTTS